MVLKHSQSSPDCIYPCTYPCKWLCLVLRQYLEPGHLQEDTWVLSMHSCFYFSFLHGFVHTLSLTSLSLPIVVSLCLPVRPCLSHHCTKLPARLSPQTPAEDQHLSHHYYLFLIHIWDLSTVVGHLFPAIHCCRISSCLSNLLAVNICTLLASQLILRLHQNEYVQSRRKMVLGPIGKLQKVGEYKQSASGQWKSKDCCAILHNSGFSSGNFRRFCIPQIFSLPSFPLSLSCHKNLSQIIQTAC